MEPLGMFLSLPWGLTVYTIIFIAVLMVIGVIWWKVMDHYPEDEQEWNEENPFIYKED